MNSRDRNFTKAKLKRELAANDERLTRYLKHLDEADKDDSDGPGNIAVDKLQEKIEAIKERRERLEGYRDELARSGDQQLKPSYKVKVRVLNILLVRSNNGWAKERF